MHLVGDRLGQSLQEVGGNLAGDPFMQLDEGELTRAVDGHQHVELALFGPHFSDVDVEVADRISLEGLPLRPPAGVRSRAAGTGDEAQSGSGAG